MANRHMDRYQKTLGGRVVGGKRAPNSRPTRDGVEVVVLNGIVGALEHVQHTLRDGEASTNVDSTGNHSQSSQSLGGTIAAAQLAELRAIHVQHVSCRSSC